MTGHFKRFYIVYGNVVWTLVLSKSGIRGHHQSTLDELCNVDLVQAHINNRTLPTDFTDTFSEHIGPITPQQSTAVQEFPIFVAEQMRGHSEEDAVKWWYVDPIGDLWAHEVRDFKWCSPTFDFTARTPTPPAPVKRTYERFFQPGAALEAEKAAEKGGSRAPKPRNRWRKLRGG